MKGFFTFHPSSLNPFPDLAHRLDFFQLVDKSCNSATLCTARAAPFRLCINRFPFFQWDGFISPFLRLRMKRSLDGSKKRNRGNKKRNKLNLIICLSIFNNWLSVTFYSGAPPTFSLSNQFYRPKSIFPRKSVKIIYI